MINENDMQLIVTEKSLGNLVTNAIEIKKNVEKALENFKAENYSEDNIDKAKEDKAMLNNTSKELNAKRIELEKEFMQPFDEFKDVVKEITTMISEASSKIDDIVKEVDNKAKEERKKIIERLYAENIKELKEVLPLEKVFDDKWLNKGSWKDEKEFKLIDELVSKIETVRNDLITIGELNSKYEVELKTDYLNNFNLGDVIRKNNDLSKKEELLSSQQEESKQVIKEEKTEKLNEMANEVVAVEENEEIETYVLEITGTRTQLFALKTFLKKNEMKFEKLT